MKEGRISFSVFAASLILASLVISPIIGARSVLIEPRLVDIETPIEEPQPDFKQSYSNLPLTFEPNLGQTDERVKFLARSPGFQLFLSDGEAVMKLRKKSTEKITSDVLSLKFENANTESTIEGVEEQITKSNYFIGNDPTKWQRDVTNYGRAIYRGIYDGIDAVFYGDRTDFEYDFVVAPNADPNDILLKFRGAKKVSIDDDGRLVLKLKRETVKFAKPFTYQETDGGRQEIASRYVMKGRDRIAFEIGEYDRSKTLVIDPKLLYSTYIGGNIEFIDIADGTGDSVNGIAVDASGNAFLTGNTDSTDFPVSSNAFQSEMELRGDDACLIQGPLPCGDAFVTKLNSTGTAILYSTYLGGHNSDAGFAIAVDSTGKAYVTGGTDPFNAANFCAQPFLFPTQNAYQIVPCYGLRADSDAFLTVLNASGSDLIYSTYFGGIDEEQGNAIAIDASGNAYIAGETNSDNLDDKNAFQPNHGNNNTDVNDAFVAKFNPNESGNSSLLYSSFLGGNGDDKAHGIAVDAAGNAYVVGETVSTNLPVKSPSGPIFDSAFNGGASDGFVAKVDPTNASGANSLVSLTYFGGTGRDVVNAVAVEADTQRAHITGRSDLATGFPLLNLFDGTATGTDAFVAKFNADVTALFYSTFLGSSSFDEGRAIVLDEARNVYIAGLTLSAGFPRVNAFQNANAGGGDTFVTKLTAVITPSVPRILYSSLHGGAGNGGDGRDQANGIAIDRKGNVYLGGLTTSTTFPTTGGVIKPTAPGIEAGNSDGYVAKVESTFNDTIGVQRPGANQFLLSNSNITGVTDLNITFGQAGDIGIVGDWEGDGKDDVGVFRAVNGQGQFIIRKLIQIRPCGVCGLITVLSNVQINFGLAGDLPMVGDWDGDGVDSVGVFRQNGGQAQIFLTNDNVLNPPIDNTLGFGTDGDLPVAGDWDADGLDEIGVFRPSTGQFFLTNDVVIANVDFTGLFGTAEDLPTAGDFDGDSRDSIAVFRPSSGQFFLTNDNINIAQTTNFGQAGDRPLAGDWDLKPNR